MLTSPKVFVKIRTGSKLQELVLWFTNNVTNLSLLLNWERGNLKEGKWSFSQIYFNIFNVIWNFLIFVLFLFKF